MGKKGKGRIQVRERREEGHRMGWREERKVAKERGEGGGCDRKATGWEKLRFPRFSNVGTPWKAKRKEDCAIVSGRMDVPACSS
jgi:hypothetical protein